MEEDQAPKRQKIEHLQQREWVLSRPETFVGAMEPAEVRLVDFAASPVATTKAIVLCPALLSLGKELCDNAVDNCQRDETQRYIRIEWRKEEGCLVVKNDGSTLPVETDAGTGRWAPSLAFGEFQSGSNFDDETGKKQTAFTVGRNGVGAKGCNVFSTRFEVRLVNAQDKKSFAQAWEKNMSVEHPPKIAATSRRTNETVVTWHPDFARLGGDVGREAMEDVCRWFAHNVSLCVPQRVKVHYNDSLIGLRTPEHFCRALGGTSPFATDATVRKDDGRTVLSICVGTAGGGAEEEGEGGGTMYAFVNGTPCCEGSHVRYIFEKVGGIVEAKAKAKRGGEKELRATSAFLQSNTVIVAVLFVERERFTDQRKRVLDAPVKDWGWRWEPSASFVSAIQRSSLPDRLVAANREKSDSVAAKQLAKSTATNIPKYEPALKRFTTLSTLIVCEGDSAGNLVRSGLSVVGRRDFGLYPLRGKFLNVRGLSVKAILENKEAFELLKILGVHPSVTYDAKSVAKLPYARLMVMTDQDVDGSHIMGLLYNLVDVCAPTLLRHKKDYLSRFATSLIRVDLGGKAKTIGFYSQAEYDEWVAARREKGERLGTPSYFKGLGTSSAEQAKEYFRNLSDNTITVVHDGGESAESLDLAFNKKRADDRKAFLTRNCDPGSYVDYSKMQTTVQDFVYSELMPQYALASLKRAIPGLDGFKEALRKVFFGARSLRLTADVSVANAAGKIASHTNYHHRATAMEDTIVGMAADYAGCSNMNLLLPHGQFGTRHKHAAASAAYPKICLNAPLHELLYPPADDAVLARVVDEGRPVEPVLYAPVICMPLVFGANGIATGWSTSVPMFHPRDVIRLTGHLLAGEKEAACRVEREMLPWYRGFAGRVERVDDSTFVVHGQGEWSGNDYHVYEMPPFRETEAFKEDWTRANLAAGGIVAGEGHTDEKIHLILKDCRVVGDPLDALGLRKRVTTTNMHLLDAKGSLRRYDSILDIVNDHFSFRMEVYATRLRHMIRKCRRDVLVATNRARFVRACIDGEYDMRNHADDEAATQACALLGLQSIRPGEEEDGASPSYDYLLAMPMRSLTERSVARLQREANEKERELALLMERTPTDLWAEELAALSRYVDSDSRLSAAGRS